MNVFTFWYVYYDSIFVEPQLKPRKIVLEGFLHEIQQPVNWPYATKEPSITRCFQILQKFIQNPENWLKSNCSENQLLQIQAKINRIYTLLLIEKQYAIQFWKTSKRRLQSSICHLFIFLQNLIRAIIPDENMTIQDCWRKHILCTKPSYIQELSHSVMDNLEKLQLFMNRPEFNSQKNLTSQFFEYYNWFIDNICSIEKKDIGKVPKLLEYINLSNPIEISKRKIVEQETIKVKIRKKSNTIGSKPQRKRKSEDFIRLNYHDFYKEFNGYVYRSQRFNKSCDSKICSKNEQNQALPNYKIPSIFKFKSQIHQNSIFQIKRKKNTISTQDCIPSLASILPANLRASQVQNLFTRTQSLQLNGPYNKVSRCNTVEMGSIPSNNISIESLRKRLESVKGEKARKKLQKNIDIIISGKDEQIERIEQKVEVGSLNLLIKSEIFKEKKQQQRSKLISLSKGSKKNDNNSEDSKLKSIEKILKNSLMKF